MRLFRNPQNRPIPSLLFFPLESDSSRSIAWRHQRRQKYVLSYKLSWPFFSISLPSFRSPLIALLLHHLFVFFLYFFTSGRKLGPTRPILGSELLIHVKCCFVPRENGEKSLRIDVVLACDWIERFCGRKFNAGIPLTFLLTWTMVRTRPSISEFFYFL